MPRHHNEYVTRHELDYILRDVLADMLEPLKRQLDGMQEQLNSQFEMFQIIQVQLDSLDQRVSVLEMYIS